MKQIDSGQSFELKPSEVGKGACPNPIGPFQGEMAKGSVVLWNRTSQLVDGKKGLDSIDFSGPKRFHSPSSCLGLALGIVGNRVIPGMVFVSMVWPKNRSSITTVFPVDPPVQVGLVWPRDSIGIVPCSIALRQAIAFLKRKIIPGTRPAGNAWDWCWFGRWVLVLKPIPFQ